MAMTRYPAGGIGSCARRVQGAGLVTLAGHERGPVHMTRGSRIYWGIVDYPRNGDAGTIKWIFAIPDDTSANDYTIVLPGGVEVPLAPLSS